MSTRVFRSFRRVSAATCGTADIEPQIDDDVYQPPTPLPRTTNCDYINRQLPADWVIEGPYSATYPHMFLGRWRARPALIKMWLRYAFDKDRWLAVSDAAAQRKCPNLLLPFESVVARLEVDTHDGPRETDAIISAYPLLAGVSLQRSRAFGRVFTADHLRMLLSEIASALQVIADTDGEAHGDVKPGNVIRDRDRGFVLLDWVPYSALLGSWEGASPTATRRNQLRFVQRVNGDAFFSQGYAAPRFRFKAGSVPRWLTSRDDTFSLGVMAYEAATGTHPFTGKPLYDPHGSIRNKRPYEAQRVIALAGAAVGPRRQGPALEKLRPDLTSDVVSVIEQCLSLNEDDRPPLSRLVTLCTASSEARQ